ncbi:hypothetical protein D6C91_10449 [Aureobasidium pullulans]|uniref:Uncharacterized protein n=1 Tax=Aureobasidium pullulans TaxID=5580 RepID=A0A4S8TFF2_AURPU|nr:hypothetical protein D6D29_04290 [Aureobasidium pullulans]THV95643.1 hypothetical protein D6D26_07373 [Aureobasidium pullulans]THZ05987.1 hypothetical protein D6C91_10449 [Aureobasidium pullulans]
MAASVNMNAMPAPAMPPPSFTKTESASQSSPQKPTKSAMKSIPSTEGADEEADGEKSGSKEDADGTAPAMATNMNMSGALQRKMSELQASGWRPPEESIDSDDDYDGVDMISNSDDEEKSMRKAEEKLMADDDEDDEESNAALARRLSLSSQNSNQAELAYLEFNDEYILPDDPFSQSFLDADQIMSAPDFFREGSPLTRTESEQTVPNQRRVRFEERAEMSDETDSDADSDFFPDLFIQQDHLDPRFRRLIEKDDDHELYQDDSSNAGSEWDFEADEMRMLLMEDEEEDSDSSAGSSGYEFLREADDGDTTDEEPMPPPPKRASTAPTSPSSVATPRPSNASTTHIRLPLRKNKNKRTPTQPKMGTFMIDPHRPVLTIDGVGVSQKSTLWPAKIQSAADKQLWQRMHMLSNNNSRATSRTTSPRQSVQLTPSGESDGMSIGDENDFFDSFGALRTDQVIGPPEAFTPFVDVTASGAIIHDDDAAAAGAEEEQDPMCFLNFDDDDEDEDMPDESDNNIASPTTQSFSSQVTNNPSSQPGGFDLLAHLDRHGVVGSFRRNQQFAKHVGSLPSHPALRASLSETNAMQTGRRAAANTPITPLRKKKAKGVGARNSPMTTTSPLKKSPPLKKKGPIRGGFSRG